MLLSIARFARQGSNFTLDPSAEALGYFHSIRFADVTFHAALVAIAFSTNASRFVSSEVSTSISTT